MSNVLCWSWEPQNSVFLMFSLSLLELVIGVSFTDFTNEVCFTGEIMLRFSIDYFTIRSTSSSEELFKTFSSING